MENHGTAYQQLVPSFQEAVLDAIELADVVKRWAKAVSAWEPGIRFGTIPEITPERNGSVSYPDWPTPERVESVRLRLVDSWRSMRQAWEAIPPGSRAGLKEPREIAEAAHRVT